MLRHWILKWDMIIEDLVKTQVIYVQSFYSGKNNVTNIYQWELINPHTFSNRRWMIYFMDSNLYMQYDILILTIGDWKNHVHKLELLLNKMKEKGPKYIIERLFFGQTKIEHLGFWVTHNGVKPIIRNIEAITNMKAPTSRKQIRQFIGVVKYYWDMWPRRVTYVIAFNLKNLQ